ncbi:MAG: Rpn family recombination-promoting nuclease/putative transposase [Spirochaetaceae bacterium]|nr:MAG: Rpn family recombination-promoting nuclease/putative transposase [Spirochaetaceae bacterium]
MKQHDNLFREMVSDPVAQRDMVRICLPDLAERIKLDTITTIDASFTGGKQADLLVSMRDHGDREHLVYMLVEHKSYHDRLVAVQLLRYSAEIWQLWKRNGDERGPLPRIYPVVLYHGKTPWTAPLKLSGLHGSADDDPEPHITDLVYRLVDLSTIEPEQLQLPARTLAYLITLRHVLRPFSPLEARMILQLIMDPTVERSIRERLLTYLVDNTGDKNTDVLLTEWESGGYTIEGGDIMTMAQELMRRGEVKGREAGREEATQHVARKMLDKGADLEFVLETTGLTAEQVSALVNSENKNKEPASPV